MLLASCSGPISSDIILLEYEVSPCDTRCTCQTFDKFLITCDFAPNKYLYLVSCSRKPLDEEKRKRLNLRCKHFPEILYYPKELFFLCVSFCFHRWQKYNIVAVVDISVVVGPRDTSIYQLPFDYPNDRFLSVRLSTLRTHRIIARFFMTLDFTGSRIVKSCCLTNCCITDCSLSSNRILIKSTVAAIRCVNTEINVLFTCTVGKKRIFYKTI